MTTTDRQEAPAATCKERLQVASPAITPSEAAIARVIAEVGKDDKKALRLALRQAYPWGERKMHPYKIWCDEIRRQLGTSRLAAPRQDPPGQGRLF